MRAAAGEAVPSRPSELDPSPAHSPQSDHQGQRNRCTAACLHMLDSFESDHVRLRIQVVVRLLRDSVAF